MNIRQINQRPVSQTRTSALANGSTTVNGVDTSAGPQGSYSLANTQLLQAFSEQVVNQAASTARFEATSYGIYSLESLNNVRQPQQESSLAYTVDQRLQKLQLTIETKEGDILSIEISADKGALSSTVDGETDKNFANRLVYKFTVEGDLNEQETSALGQLLPGLMQDAATFFNTPDSLLQLDSLQSINTNQISAVDIDLSARDKNFNANYEFDGASQMYTLDVNQNNYRYNIAVSNDALFSGGDIKNNADMKQYLELIDGVMEDHYGVSSDAKADFFSAGLVSLMSIAASPEGKEGKEESLPLRQSFDALLPKGQVAAKRMFSGLPDFTAEFKSPQNSPNHKNKSELSLLNLSLSKKTTVLDQKMSAGLLTHIEQKIDVDIDSRKHSRLPDRLKIDFDKGDYVYEIKKMHYQETRDLKLLDKSTPIFAQVSQHTVGDYERKEVRNDKVVSRDKNHIDHATVQDVLALVTKEQSPNEVIDTLIKRQMVEEIEKLSKKLEQ